MLKHEQYYCHNLKVITNLCNQREEMTTTNHSFVQSIFMCKFCFKKYSYIINFGIKIELNDGLNGMVKKEDRIG